LTSPGQITAAEVDAICRLIDHAKAKGIRTFEGPAGIRFAFDRESRQNGPGNGAVAPREVGDDWIP